MGRRRAARHASEPGRPAPHRAFEALRIVNYQRFALAFVASSTGLQMLTTAVLWEVWERTHDALWLGWVGLARALPVVGLALVAGHAADVRSRHVILGLTQAGFALVAAAFATASMMGAHPAVFLGILVVSGVVRAFNGPSRASLLPLLVPEAAFPNAVACNSGIFQFSAIAGPLLAGGILRITHEASPVYICAAGLCACSAVIAISLKPAPAVRATGGFTVSSMLAGMSHIWKEKTVFGALTLDLLAVLFGGATALLPIFADEILGTGPVGLGLLRAAPFIGALGTAAWLAAKPEMRRAGPALLASVALFGLCMIGFGLSTSMLLSVILLAVSGAVDNVSVVVRHMLVQARTPNHLRGRVSAVNSLFIECSNELGAFESGLVSRLFGPVISVVSGGAGTLLVVAFTAWAFPQLATLGRVTEPRRPVEEVEAESTSTAR
ncbi:MAG: MFS transporter [Phycisphaerales bacterium]